MSSESRPQPLSLLTPMRRLSLKFRLAALSVSLFILFIWALVFISTSVMEEQLGRLLAKQQFAATTQLARELEHKLKDDIAGLTLAAAGLPAELGHDQMQALLAQRPLMHVAFSGGVVLVGLDGRAIADYPTIGRHNTYYGDRDWFRQVVATGQPYIDRPVVGRVLNRPVLTLAVPVFDAAKRVRAVLIGGIDLSAANFLGFVSDPGQTGDNELFVISRRDQLIIAATNQQRALTPLPERGRNIIIDQMLDGFEGSGVAVSSEGIQKLYSGKRVPTANWLILSALPTKIAYGPIRTTQKYIYVSATLLTLLAIFLTGLLVRRTLAPLDAATLVIGEMTEQQRPLAPLPVQRSDEIGSLLRNFNRLVVDRLAYEAALSDSERRFRRLIEGAPDAIFVQTRGCFSYVNDTALALFGATHAEQLLGQPCLERIHPDDRARIAERIQRINVDKEINPPLEQTYLRLDGSSVAVEVSAVPFQQGGEHGALAFVRDITEKKRAGVELAHYRNHLEELVAERTLQLADAKQAAETANRAKSIFLATMSHEIRTPLNAVLGLTDLLAESPLNRQQRDCADKIQLSAQGLRRLIDDILDFSKIEAGGLQLEQTPFSLSTVLRTAAAVLSIGTRGKAIEALFDVAPGVPDALQGDSLRLQQILLNLISNAVKFTESGEIVVSVRRLAGPGGPATLQFAVHDSGIGIPPEQLQRIFAAFTQAECSTSRQYGGTGLGLAISARLAALMSGQITVDSTIGQGSEFRCTVTLPLANDVPATPPADDLAGLNILIVDDHPLARDILSRSCAKFGWRTTTVDSGAACLAELQRNGAEGHDYDLMLLDWHMPGQDGIAMLRQAQDTPGLGLPLVILMTPAFELEQAVAASDELYLDGIVAKPLTPESLREAVQRAYSGECDEFAELPGKTDRRLAGMRLLVAEDNEINRGLMERILCRAGAEVVLASNGRTAVDALQKPDAPFDAVLMDLQMPLLDGFSATRIIREELGLLDLPIFAVTANALPEDQDQLQRVGMDGLLIKPIDIEDLLDLLTREQPVQPPAAVAQVAMGPATDNDIPRLSLPGLDGAALKAFGGDAAAYGELLAMFAVQHGGDAGKVRWLLGEGEPEKAARLVHELGGVCGFLRATEVAALAAATETALRQGGDAGLAELLDKLEEAMHTLVQSIQRFETTMADL